MSVLDLDANGSFGENGSGILYIATDYDWVTFDDGTGTNEDESLATIAADYTFADIGYFENFAWKLKAGDERVIETDYCDVWEISRKAEQVAGFTVDVQEIMDMTNLALMLGVDLNSTSSGHQIVGLKRIQRTKPYQLFKFVTCPKDGLSNTFYFVKAVMIGDLDVPVINLNRNDFAGVPMEFEIAEGGNFFIDKDILSPQAEIQTLTVDASGGTYTITFNGETTSALAYNATANTVQNAMEALAHVGVGDVIVTGGVGAAGGGTPYTFTWAVAKGNVSTPTTTTSLTGGASTAVFAVSQQGI